MPIGGLAENDGHEIAGRMKPGQERQTFEAAECIEYRFSILYGLFSERLFLL